ncbi:FkbM family methyltransferase [Spirosoma koreense]
MLTKFFKQFPLYYAIKFSILEMARRVFSPDSSLTYSQTGEDIIIRTFLEKNITGFYVEIGSNEPIQHSNTFGLYQKGWRGITVDANQKMVDMHKSLRPNDISLCAAVSDIEKEVIFYEFDMDEISTIDNDFYNKHKDIQKVSRQSTLRTRTLDSILIESLPAGTDIDLLSIDVEGHDYHVLRSINLNKYRPKLIVIEMHNFDILLPLENQVYKWLLENRYHLAGYAVWNGYFIANEWTPNE